MSIKLVLTWTLFLEEFFFLGCFCPFNLVQSQCVDKISSEKQFERAESETITFNLRLALISLQTTRPDGN